MIPLSSFFLVSFSVLPFVSRSPRTRPVLRLKNLTYLNLEHNSIIELPNQFDKLRFLRHINLRDNQLEEINDGVLVMDGMEKFNVGQNKLIALPNNIGILPTSIEL